jgi:hypothetical protein
MAVDVQPCGRREVMVVVTGGGGVAGREEGPLVGDRLLESAAHHPAFLLIDR